MADTQRKSPLSHRTALGPAAGYAVQIEEVTGRGMIDLRGNPDDPSFMAAAQKAIGLELPTEPRTSATKGKVSVLWLSIDQWLITMPIDSCDKMLASLQKETGTLFALACDVSDARAIIRLEGKGVREVLIKGTSVDLTKPEFVKGVVRRMTFAEIAAMCHIVGTSPDVIDLYVFRSYADYTWEWLEATATEASKVTIWNAQDVAAG